MTTYSIFSDDNILCVKQMLDGGAEGDGDDGLGNGGRRRMAS